MKDLLFPKRQNAFDKKPLESALSREEKECHKRTQSNLESQTELENIVKVSEYSVKFGAEKEQIAREAVEKNGFVLTRGEKSNGFVWYEFYQREMLLQAKREKEIEEKKRKRTTTEEEEENKRVQQQQQNPSRPNMKMRILEVVKKLQPFYAKQDISKRNTKRYAKKRARK